MVYMAGVAHPRLGSLLESGNEHIAPGHTLHLKCLEAITPLQVAQRLISQVRLEITLNDKRASSSKLGLHQQVEHLNSRRSEFPRPFALTPTKRIVQHFLDSVLAEQRPSHLLS